MFTSRLKSFVEEESGALLNDEVHKDYSQTSKQEERSSSLTLKMAICLLTTIATTSIVSNIVQFASIGAVYSTDLPDARGSVEYERRVFTGGLVYRREEHRVVRLSDGEKEFFGPEKEVDTAWDELLHGQYRGSEELKRRIELC